MGEMIEIDFNKVITVNDLKIVLRAMYHGGQKIEIGPSNEMYGMLQKFKKDK